MRKSLREADALAQLDRVAEDPATFSPLFLSIFLSENLDKVAQVCNNDDVTDLQKTPLYRLGYVLEETGLQADTIRVWEKRYGFPMPRRTGGRHRLYSRRDIRALQWMKARLEEGMRISKAIRLWRDMEAQGIDPLTADLPKGVPELEKVCSEWILACLDFDEPRAEALLDAALESFPAEKVCLQVLRQGVHKIGEMWYRAEATVQQEHFASELAMRRLHHLMVMTPSSRKEVVLVGTPSGELHGLSALLLGTLLRLRGWDTRLLGPNVPEDRLKHTLSITRPMAVLYSAQLLTSVPALQATARLLQAEGIPLGYAGWVFNRYPSIRKRVAGFFLGETFEEALDSVEALSRVDVSQLEVQETPLRYRQAAEALALSASAIVAQMRLLLSHIPEKFLEQALNFTLEQWWAALQLGDLTPLHEEMQWIAHLLEFRSLDPSWLEHYWQAWRKVIFEHLGDLAIPILEFFDHSGG